MNNIAYIVTLASIIGTVANSFQKRWCFYIWLCTNAFWCIYNIINKQYAQALLYLFNFIMAIIGLVKWNKNGKYNGVIKKINKALSIDLYDWQIQYIFYDGDYHGEYNYGRRNGKTLANILRLLLSEGETVYIYASNMPKTVENLVGYLKEDDSPYKRVEFFCNELIDVYSKLEKVKGLNIRRIEIIL